MGWLGLPRVSWPVSQRGAGLVALSSPVRRSRSLRTILEPLAWAAQGCGSRCLMEQLLAQRLGAALAFQAAEEISALQGHAHVSQYMQPRRQISASI